MHLLGTWERLDGSTVLILRAAILGVTGNHNCSSSFKCFPLDFDSLAAG
jgi:hypothetical protein